MTGEAGIKDVDGRGLGVVAADLDEDGRVDLFVANDMTANYLFRNQGQFRFKETGLAAGVAGNASGGFQAGMGVACGDLDGDGRFDLAVTNYYNESTSFFRNLGQGFFGDQSAAIGLATPSRYVLGFGIAFLDADNDGWLDLMTANGHVYDGSPQFPWKMPVQLYHNRGGGRPFLTDVSMQAGAPFQTLRMGRGLAAGDLDNDGRVDALVVSQNEPLAYFHNRSESGHFLTLRLEGRTSNRDAVGARVTVRCGGRAWSRSESAAVAISLRATRGCTSAWDHRPLSNGSRCAGLPGGWTVTMGSMPTPGISFAKEIRALSRLLAG